MTTLTAEQTRTLENLLIQREKQLSAEVAAATAAERQGDDSARTEVLDSKDVATNLTAGGIAHAELERDLNELKAVQAARQRLAGGLYGQCADCEEPIGFERLQAQPAASRCARCQAGYEERHAR